MFVTNSLGGRFDEGFQMKFKNGWTVSVQWHEGAYSDEENKTAEIAAWNKDDVWYDFGHDTVKGWQTPEDVASFIKMISEKPKWKDLRSYGDCEIPAENS